MPTVRTGFTVRRRVIGHKRTVYPASIRIPPF
jgi:hypothetical protein